VTRPPARRPATGRRPRGAADGSSGAVTGWERSGRGRAARERAQPDEVRGRRGTVEPPAAAPEPSGTERSGPERSGTARSGTGRSGTARAATARSGTERAGTGRSGTDGSGKARRTGTDRRPADPERAGGLGAGRPPRGSSRPVPARYRRRRLAAALAAAVVLLVGVGVGTRVLLYDAGLADVEEVTVTGLAAVPEQAVRDAAAVAPGGPLVSVDTAGIARRVAAVEGVASVVVRRAWPHTVEVDVTERVPLALWPTPQAVFEVDGTGLPYRLAPQPPPALPRLAFTGVGPQDPSTAAALAVLHDLPDRLRAQVATVEVAGVQVTLGLADGRSVRWGGPERSADKIGVIGALLGQPGSVYDVSSPDLPTVRR
jgi:cell division protein FtsQ